MGQAPDDGRRKTARRATSEAQETTKPGVTGGSDVPVMRISQTFSSCFVRSGKSLLIIGTDVKPRNQKYFAFHFGKSEL
jgi:hypothetical protein